MADGLSMLTFLSKAQDGGEEAHAVNGVKYPERKPATLSERYAKIGKAFESLARE